MTRFKDMALRFFNTYSREIEEFEPRDPSGASSQNVHVRADRLQPGAHWKFPRLHLRRSASAALGTARLQGASRDEYHGCGGQDDSRRTRGQRSAAKVHGTIQRGFLRRRPHVAYQARGRISGRDRPTLYRPNDRDDQCADFKRARLPGRRQISLLSHQQISGLWKARALRSHAVAIDRPREA